MDKDYIKFILAYDFGEIFERMKLSCDEAYELADEIADRYHEWLKENDDMEYHEYELLQYYCSNISFYAIWQEMRENNHDN